MPGFRLSKKKNWPRPGTIDVGRVGCCPTRKGFVVVVHVVEGVFVVVVVVVVVGVVGVRGGDVPFCNAIK